MNENQEMLTKGSFKKLFLNLCIPTIVIMLVLVIYNMADIYFIGQTGDPAKIAAVSICSPIFSTLSGLGTLLGSGGCTAISLALGENDKDSIHKYSAFCFIGSLAIGIICTIGLMIGLEPIAKFLGADSSTMANVLSYLRIIALGAPITLFGNVFTNLIRADGAAKQSMIANGLGTISNIILDAIFILIFHWDVAGAAIATVLGNAFSCIYLIHYISSKQELLSLNPKYFTLKKEVSLKVISLGVPLACSTLMMSFSNAYANRLVAGYGPVAVAAQGVSGKIGMLITMISMGICMGLQPALSINYSQHNFTRLKYIMKWTAVTTIVVGSLLSLGCYVARDSIIAAFIDNEEVLTYGQTMVIAGILIGPFYGLYQLCQTFLQATGKASYATFTALLDKGILYIPILIILSHVFGLYGIVFTGAVTLVFSLTIGFILSLVWWNKITKVEQELAYR